MEVVKKSVYTLAKSQESDFTPPPAFFFFFWGTEYEVPVCGLGEKYGSGVGVR